MEFKTKIEDSKSALSNPIEIITNEYGIGNSFKIEDYSASSKKDDKEKPSLCISLCIVLCGGCGNCGSCGNCGGCGGSSDLIDINKEKIIL